MRQNTSTNYPVNYKATVISGEKLKLKRNKNGTLSRLIVSSGCYLQAGSRIEIEKNTVWVANAVMVSANHDMGHETKQRESAAPIKIGKHCWIGANVLVGAGVVVTKNFPQGNVVIAGNPAKIIK